MAKHLTWLNTPWAESVDSPIELCRQPNHLPVTQDDFAELSLHFLAADSIANHALVTFCLRNKLLLSDKLGVVVMQFFLKCQPILLLRRAE